MTCDLFAELLDDYITAELAATDRLAVEAHATVCPACGAQLADLRQAVGGVLALAPAVDPPVALRQRILAQARQRPSPSRRERRWRLPSLQLGQVAALASAAALVISVGIGVWSMSMQTELSRQSSENARLRDQLGRQRDMLYVLMSPTLLQRTMAAGELAPTAHGRIYVDPMRRQGMVVATDLPRLDAERGYQVWLRSKSGVVSAGMMRIDERGTGYIIIESTQPLEEFEAIGISLEPAGGSAQPTGPRMLFGNL